MAKCLVVSIFIFNCDPHWWARSYFFRGLPSQLQLIAQKINFDFARHFSNFGLEFIYIYIMENNIGLCAQ